MLPIVSQRSQGIGAAMEVVLLRKIILVLLISLIMERNKEIVFVNILLY